MNFRDIDRYVKQVSCNGVRRRVLGTTKRFNLNKLTFDFKNKLETLSIKITLLREIKMTSLI